LHLETQAFFKARVFSYSDSPCPFLLLLKLLFFVVDGLEQAFLKSKFSLTQIRLAKFLWSLKLVVKLEQAFLKFKYSLTRIRLAVMRPSSSSIS